MQEEVQMKLALFCLIVSLIGAVFVLYMVLRDYLGGELKSKQEEK